MAQNKACEGYWKLADGVHGPVLQISKKQNRELPYASSAEQADNVTRNFVNGEVSIRRRKLFVMKKFVKVVFLKAMKPNGPAIWGGCVTRRKHRAGS